MCAEKITIKIPNEFLTQRPKEPIIRIPQEIWSKIIEEAQAIKGKIRAFALFSKRRTHYDIVEYREIDVEEMEPGIFRFRNMKTFYRQRPEPRYSGTVVVQDNLEMTLHYAYWMGYEKIDFNINLKIDNGKPIWKSYWVYPSKTHGKFVPIKVQIREQRSVS